MIKTDLHISKFMLHEDRIIGDKSGSRDTPPKGMLQLTKH